MIIIPVTSICGGEILAESIMNPAANVIIPAGTVIKKEYSPLIESFGVESLAIVDPFEEVEKPHDILPIEIYHGYVKEVQALMEKHIYHGDGSLKEMENIANRIVEDIEKAEHFNVYDFRQRAADLYTHTVGVTMLSVLLADKLELSQEKKKGLALGALLHDIGIRYITTTYVNRNIDDGDPADISEFKKHTILGYSAMEKESWIPEISKKIILSHHERLDGSGFPMRQKNKEIEIHILQVADSFDSEISGTESIRYSVEEALEHLKAKSGKQLNPKVVDALSEHIASHPVGTHISVDGEDAIVVEQGKQVGQVFVRKVTEDRKLGEEIISYCFL